MSTTETPPGQAGPPAAPGGGWAPPPEPAGTTAMGRTGAALGRVQPIWWILLALVLAIVVVQLWRSGTFFFDGPAQSLALLRRAAPLMAVALGQLFVIVSGEFDLSVGTLITAVVVIAAGLSQGDGSSTWWLILLLLGFGLLVGLINGLVTTKLRVPSIITTLGMWFILEGAVFFWTSGAPRGALAENFRQWGRLGIEGSFVTDVLRIPNIPYSVLIVLALGLGAGWLMHRTRYGHQVFATGGNTRASVLSGVNTDRVRIIAFVLCSVLAVVGGILLAGFSGVSPNAGFGYELQSIAAVVLAGAVLGGGRGSVPTALAGALTLEVLFTLLNLLGLAKPVRDTIQGVIIIAAAAYAARRLRT